jgi:hypothetical protein
MIAGMAAALSRPSSGPELTSVPWPGVAIPDTAGSGWSVATTTRTGRPNFRAKSRSRWSWAGTAMIAPVP